MIFLPHLDNAGVGVKSGYQMVKSSLELGLLLSGGLSGRIGTRFALKAKSAQEPP